MGNESMVIPETPAIPVEVPAVAGEGSNVVGKMKSGASWFYWLAGLSLINSIIALTNGEWSFLFGLGATQVVDALVMGIIAETPSSAMIAKALGFSLNVIIAGVFILFGWLAQQRMRWAFIVGMTFYALDAGLFWLAGDFLGLAFHGWVFFSLCVGLCACHQLCKQEASSLAAVSEV